MPDHRTRTVHVPGLVLSEHELDVPLDHAAPDGATITFFAREVADVDGRDRPFLVFLQGGPGSEAPRPMRLPTSPGWLDRALQDFRVLMVDQRGTGRSEPVGTLSGLTAQQQADHLTHFRADAIVRDLELLRSALGVDRWSVLGQSFGGFCTMTYLSLAPEGLREAFFTGGVPPVGRPIDDVYAATYATQRERNRRYYDRYPQDCDVVRALHKRADAGELVLPNGDTVSSNRLRQLGAGLGMSYGAEQLHYLLELDPDSPAFRHDLAGLLGFSGRHPVYAALQEACYADGQATRWAALRTLPDDYREDLTLLTGEHVYPWSLAEDRELAPLSEATDLLATYAWPRLYDEGALRSCEVPAAAAIYAEDTYVDRALSEETAAMVPTLKQWITNEYEHNGLRADGAAILDRLVGMARGRLA